MPIELGSWQLAGTARRGDELLRMHGVATYHGVFHGGARANVWLDLDLVLSDAAPPRCVTPGGGRAAHRAGARPISPRSDRRQPAADVRPSGRPRPPSPRPHRPCASPPPARARRRRRRSAASRPRRAPPTTPLTPTPARAGTFEGTLPDGATWTIDVPADWNGTLLLYGHGLVPPGRPNPAEVAPDPVTRERLVDDGFALAGSSYASTGMAVEEAVADQLAVIDVFAAQVAVPTRTIAWGSSLGGLVTALLLDRHADRVDGGLSLCGPLAGGTGLWNTYLDALFVLSTLLDTPVPLVGVADPDDAFAAVEALRAALDTAQTTPQGRARIALAAAMMDLPGWIGAGNPRPGRHDVDVRRRPPSTSTSTTTILFGLVLRADQEARSGGNPSTNAGVDYGLQLRRSSSDHEVRALYRSADLSLHADLARLAAAPRVAADPGGEDPAGRAHLAERQPATTRWSRCTPTAISWRRSSTSRPTRRPCGDAGSGRASCASCSPSEPATARSRRPRSSPPCDVVLRAPRHRCAGRATSAPRALDRRALLLGPDLNVAFDDESQSLIPVEPAFSALRPGAFLR